MRNSQSQVEHHNEMLAGQISPPCRVLLCCCAAAVLPLPSMAEVRREKNTGEPPVLSEPTAILPFTRASRLFMYPAPSPTQLETAIFTFPNLKSIFPLVRDIRTLRLPITTRSMWVLLGFGLGRASCVVIRQFFFFGFP